MTDDGKKLTVAFGAFSCTLDGFDDPMPVLSKVLEQFQAISKDDPGFGSSPLAATAQHMSALAEATGASVAAEGTTLKVTAGSAAEPGDFDTPAEGGGADGPWEDYSLEAIQDAAESSGITFDQTDEEDTAEDDTLWDGPTLSDTAGQPDDIEPARAEGFAPEPIEVALDAPDAENGDPEDFVGRLVAALGSAETAAAPENGQTDAVEEEPVALSFAAQDEDPANDADAFLETAPEPVDLTEEEAALERMLSASRDPRETVLSAANPLRHFAPDTNDAMEAQDHADMTGQAHTDLSAAPEPAPQPAPLRLDMPIAAPDKDETQAPPLRLNPLPLDTPVEAPAMDTSEPETEATPFRLEPAVPSATAETSVPQSAGSVPGPGVLQLVPNAPDGHDDAAADDHADLRDFAQSVGASSMPELMEASAAYVTLVGNRASFSRREIFDYFDQLSADATVSFEARIKTLSRLLRTGVLERGEDGSFSMSRAARAQYEERLTA